MTRELFIEQLRQLAIDHKVVCPEAFDPWLQSTFLVRAAEKIAIQLWLDRSYDEGLAWFLTELDTKGGINWADWPF